MYNYIKKCNVHKIIHFKITAIGSYLPNAKCQMHMPYTGNPNNVSGEIPCIIKSIW